jgi:hypothetical protein
MDHDYNNDDDDNDAELKPEQYARDHGLSINSQISPFSLILKLDSSLPQTTPDAGPSGLTSDSSLPEFNLPTLHLQERLDVPRESIDFLVETLRHQEIDANDLPETPLSRYEARKHLNRLKLELPALTSDPDYDCRELAKTIREQRQPDISSSTFPPERLNIAGDEGLEFPKSAHQFRLKLYHTVRQQKLDVSKKAIGHLARALQDDWSEDKNCRIIEEALLRRTVRVTCGFFSLSLSPGSHSSGCKRLGNHTPT